MAGGGQILVLVSDAPEALVRDVISAGRDLDDVRLEVETDFPEVRLTIHPLEGLAGARRRRAVEEASRGLGRTLASCVVSRYGFSLPEALVGSLTRRKLGLGIAESCTGGLVSHLVTNVEGASRVLVASTVVYANHVKTSLLGVRQATLEKHGAVSRSVAGQMLDGLAAISGVSCAMVTTGIAGPGGGTREKPVGLVYLGARVGARRRIVRRILRGRSRERFKLLASYGVMKLLLDMVRSEQGR